MEYGTYMKLMYTGAFLITVCSLIFVLLESRKNKREIAHIIRKIMGAGLISVLANLVLMFSYSERVSEIAYSIFFASVTWLLFLIWMFAVEFTDYKRRMNIRMPLVMGIVIVDTISMLSNNFTHHAYTCHRVISADKELFYQITPLWGYQIHLFTCYFLSAVILILLICKTLKSDTIYRGKYLLVVGILLLVLVWDANYVVMGALVDTSIVGYAFGSIVIYYYAGVFIPGELLKQTLSQVVTDMSDGILIYDADGNLLHKNESARKFMELYNQEVEKEESSRQNTKQWLEEHPLDTLEEFEENWSFGEGENQHHVKVFFHRMENEEKRYLGSFFVFQDHTEEVKSLQKERYAANHDPLTGIYNHSRFEQRCREQLASEPEEHWLMICSDVKNFKLVNDVFGVETGDRLLQSMAKQLLRNTIPGEIYGRIQNDRFALLMRKRDYNESRILSMAEEAVHIDGDVTYPIHLYLGVYEVIDSSVPISIMCDRAFIAISTIKGQYEAQIAYYDAALRANVLHEQELTTEVDEAMNEGQFLIYLQPQTDVQGKALGAEALVRWMHPKEGLLMPGKFVGLLEKNGTISKLDCHVWELACRQLRAWKEQGREQMYISVNISPRDFYFLDIYKTFTELVERYEINPANLKLEITETAVMQDVTKQMSLIEKLRNYGFVVEMDDFGSGYSSLNMLKDIHVDLLKLDMGFLGRTDDESRARTIIRTIVELSSQLDMQLITEGVETKEQVDFLESIGCGLFQGYYFAKPMPVAEFENRYMSQTK